MYPRAGESIITRSMCPQSNMEMVLSCRRVHHFQDNICQHSITCYIAAGCYVNCVLGYDQICYDNMLLFSPNEIRSPRVGACRLQGRGRSPPRLDLQKPPNTKGTIAACSTSSVHRGVRCHEDPHLTSTPKQMKSTTIVPP